MRSVITHLIILLIYGLSATTLSAQTFQTSAPQALLLDGETGAVLYEKDASNRFEPASLAKLMTAEVIFHLIQKDQLTAQQTFTVSNYAWRTGGAPSRTSTMFAALNSSISVQDLLRGMIVVNGNDAAIVLAEGVAGSENQFAKLMNDRAKEIGLTDSHFVNATGLPADGQYTTALDMAKLSRHIALNYPKMYTIYQEPAITWSKIFQRNKNPLMNLDIGAEGLALGFSERSGFSIAAAVKKNNRQLFLVLNGFKKDKDRTSESVRLINWGLTGFDRKLVYDTGDVVGYARVFGGQSTHVPVIVKSPVGIMLANEKAPVIRAKIVYHGPLDAPIKSDTKIGMLQILAGKNVLVQSAVYTAADVSETGLAGKTQDALYELTVGWLRQYF